MAPTDERSRPDPRTPEKPGAGRRSGPPPSPEETAAPGQPSEQKTSRPGRRKAKEALDEQLDEGLDESFPASDPPSVTQKPR
ncbi:MAG TPA: hypothetical protein VFV10_07860 [Gammaproteobacteria bacterium]|nr:hypothetical protein [Gammaproteobacteria bacterium]